MASQFLWMILTMKTLIWEIIPGEVYFDNYLSREICFEETKIYEYIKLMI